jgi:membrane fusion protein (multidrug efflux system)
MNKALIAFGLLAILSMSSCKTQKEEKEEGGNYTTTSPLKMDTSFVKEYVAQIQSIQNIEIRAKVKGFIERINVDEGQLVKEGQLLFTIRPREYEAELQKVKAQVRTAELEMQNIKTLSDKGIVSKTELSLAMAKLDEARADEALAALYVSYTKITAPFSGIIDRLKFKVGSLIDEGTLLTSLSNNKEVFAYFNVSEQEYLDYKSKGITEQKNVARLVLANGQAHQYEGNIETIEGEFDNNTGNIAFRAKFPNPNYLLKHGETGKVQLPVSIKNALMIPQKATFELQDKVYVYVIESDHKAHSRCITIKQKLSNIYIVESGLTEKDTILLEGLQSVKENDVIKAVFVSAKQAMSIK